MTGPLQNLKVLDFSTLLPGPYCTRMLADMGADVLKVESPTRHDLVRTMPPFDDGVSVIDSAINRNKRSLALDLKHPAAVDLVKKLVGSYDILVEQFRPGVMDRLGVGYELLREVNPKLIFCSITGYGQTGPFRDRAGHDNNYLSIAGINAYSGLRGEKPPLMGTQIADIAGGSMHAVVGILSAVNQRAQTGKGAYIDISMTDAAFAMNALRSAPYLTHGIEPEQESDLLNGGSHYDYYKTSDGRYMSVGSLEPKFLQGLVEILDDEQLKIWAGNPNEENLQQIKQTLVIKFKSKTYQEWCEIFAAADVCVEPVLKFSEACEHPQIQARNMIVDLPLANGKSQKQIATPIRFDNQELQYHSTGAQSGAHNREILEELQFSEGDIQQLISDGLFGP